MSRYARLLDEGFDTTDEPSSPPSSSSSLSPPPSSAFFLTSSNNSHSRSNNNNNNAQRMSNMLASLKETAVSASGSLRENMGKASSSVRSGLGLPSGNAVDNDNNNNNADESDAMTEASGSSSQMVLEEISDYCPKLTYQQVRVWVIEERNRNRQAAGRDRKKEEFTNSVLSPHPLPSQNNNKQRIYGFFLCFGIGYLLTFASFHLLIKLALGNPAPFVFMYTSGNILSLASSTFLSGPSRQCKLMFDERRREASLAYLTSLICSIVICFIPMKTGLKIGLLVLCEFVVIVIHRRLFLLIDDLKSLRTLLPSCVLLVSVLLVQRKFSIRLPF